MSVFDQPEAKFITKKQIEISFRRESAPPVNRPGKTQPGFFTADVIDVISQYQRWPCLNGVKSPLNAGWSAFPPASPDSSRVKFWLHRYLYALSLLVSGL